MAKKVLWQGKAWTLVKDGRAVSDGGGVECLYLRRTRRKLDDLREACEDVRRVRVTVEEV